MMDDPTLLRRFAEEHREDDFAELVRRHLSLVYRAALRRTDGDAHLAQDIAQQVFTSLAQEAGKVMRHPVLAGWLYVTTRHAASKALRTEARRSCREQEAYAMNELTTPDNPGAEWDRLRPELDRVMDELSERDRQAVLLRYFENKPFGEIGATLRLTENAARMRVERALEKLRSLLVKRGIVSSSAALAALLTDQAAAAVPNTLATTITGAALTGGASVTAATGLIAFMTTTKILSVTAVALCVVAGLVVFENREAGKLHAMSATLQRQCESTGLELDEARLQTERLKNHNRELSEKQAALKKLLTERSVKKKAPVATIGEHLLYSDPEYQRRWFEQKRIRLRSEYAFLYRKLGLAPQQIQEFEDAQYAAQQSAIAVRTAILSQGIVPGDPAFEDIARKECKGLKDALNEKLSAILGESGLAAYTAFENRVRGVSSESLAMDLYYSAAPLSVDQMFKLDAVLIANSSKEGGDADWAKVFDEVEGLLQPSQLKALKQKVERLKVGKQMSELRQRLASETP